MRQVWLTTTLVLLLVLVIPGIFSLAIRKIPSSFQPPLSDAQSINKETSVKQSLKAKNNNLAAIGLSIKNPYFRNSQDLIFNLFDNQNQLLRTIKLNGKNIVDGNFILINFDQIENSQNKFYSFSLSAPNTTSAEALEIYHSQQNPQDGGVYSVNNVAQNGQLSFVSFYSPSSPAANLITIYRNWIYKFFQDLPFAIFYLTIISIGVGNWIFNHHKIKD